LCASRALIGRVKLSDQLGYNRHIESQGGTDSGTAVLRYNWGVRRLLLLAVLGAVTVLPLSLQAQRGFAARAPVRVAPHMAAPPARMMPRGIPAGGVHFVPPGRFGHPVFVNPRFRHHHHFFFTSGCFGNPFLCSGFYYPYPLLSYPPLFWPETQYVQQPYPVVQQTYDDTAVRNQIDRLTDEVERLRQEQEARQATPPTTRSAVEQASPTVLVFRDGHRSEVQNYAIVGQTLWVFTERHANKYPLSDLDLPATKASSEERGGEFALPSR